MINKIARTAGPCRRQFALIVRPHTRKPEARRHLATAAPATETHGPEEGEKGRWLPPANLPGSRLPPPTWWRPTACGARPENPRRTQGCAGDVVKTSATPAADGEAAGGDEGVSYCLLKEHDLCSSGPTSPNINLKGSEIGHNRPSTSSLHHDAYFHIFTASLPADNYRYTSTSMTSPFYDHVLICSYGVKPSWKLSNLSGL
ncbi:uncharacterized protein LOC121056043 [Oryza brachyantha]|uniref:uncharacterized protein LOC121056043 n=1 Tax=Oryza brachyantha TaxID=4533 RepID=UPI001ADD1986|nr:uncharacterized protein LOC121056043 [Oryza brachyantha]